MAKGGKNIEGLGEFDEIVDPGLIGPPKGNKPPEFFPKVELFHKNEGDLFEEIKQVYVEELGGDVDDIDLVELLLPAVQQTESLAFLKVEWTTEGSPEAIVSHLSEAGYDGQVLLPAVQAADETFNKSTPKLMLKIEGVDGESQDMPEQSAWSPLDDYLL